MFTNSSSVDEAVSSSFSVAASVDTSSALLLRHLSTPRFVAKSPSLVNANKGAAEATTIRGPVPPCNFTLRGKGWAREHEDGSGGRVAMTDGRASPSPRRVIRVDTGEGYSPRLRMMGGQQFVPHGDKVATAATPAADPGSAASAAEEQESGALLASTSGPIVAGADASAFAGLKDTNCGLRGRVVAHDVITSPQKQRVFSPRGNVIDCSERESPPDVAVETVTNTSRENQPTTNASLELPGTRERGRATSLESRLCGRLWTGRAAAPKSNTTRPRVLFLVSGQQPYPHKDVPRVRPVESNRREIPRRREIPLVISLPPPVNGRTYHGRSKRARSGARTWAIHGERGANWGKDRGRCGDCGTLSRSPRESDGGGSQDVETTAATDGKGNDSAKQVVHVRVPPTPLLVFRSILPAV